MQVSKQNEIGPQFLKLQNGDFLSVHCRLPAQLLFGNSLLDSALRADPGFGQVTDFLWGLDLVQLPTCA